MNNAYYDIMLGQVEQAMVRANAVRNINHSGMMGELRETFIKDLLVPLLPADFVVGSGKVVSSYEQTSAQTDVIVGDRRVLPPMLASGSIGIFPIEATMATIEIKSRLTLEELRTAHAAAAHTATFRHAPPVGQLRYEEGHSIEHVIPCLFAFDTDLAHGGKTEIDRYIQLLEDEAPAIRLLCVAGRGLWTFNGQWSGGMLPSRFNDVMAFVGMLTNFCQRVASSRRQPDLFNYISRREFDRSTQSTS